MRALLFIVLLSVSTQAQADPGKIKWPTRNSEVVCGGSVDGETLNVRVVNDELMGAEAASGRMMLYVDLHKPGQVHLLLSDVVSDEDYVKREELLAKLTPEEAALIRKLTIGRQTELYSGFVDGFVDMRIEFGARVFSFSCKEVPNS